MPLGEMFGCLRKRPAGLPGADVLGVGLLLHMAEWRDESRVSVLFGQTGLTTTSRGPFASGAVHHLCQSPHVEQ